MSAIVMQDLADKLPLSPPEAQALLTAPDMPFEIDTAEVRGIRTKVWKNSPNSLRDVFLTTEPYQNSLYLVYEDQRMTYGEHFEHVVALCNRMTSDFSVKEGDRVVIAMRNRCEWVIAFWAVAALGAVVVPLNAWWTGPELTYGIRDSGAFVAILDDSRHRNLLPYLSELDLDAVIVAPDLGQIQPAGTISFESLAKPVPGQILPGANINPDDDATIFYTSGTSGEPKGALGTQRNICSCITSIAYAGTANELIDGRMPSLLSGEVRKGVGLISVPFFHVTGCHAILMGTTMAGNALIIMRKWDVERALQLIEQEKVTGFAGVPGMAWQILESPVLEQYDTSSLVSISYGGAPAAPGLRHRFQDKLKTTSPRNSYGMTETSSLATSITGQYYLDRPDSVGQAIPVMELKIVGAEGQTITDDEVGELWMFGPNIVKGYWRKPEATAESFTDGWVHSGDLARIDEDGYLYIVDRAKDMLIRGGENIYCVEVEDALYAHPEIMDAAVFGKPHDILGEEVVAVVQRTRGAKADETAVQGFLKGMIADFKIPIEIYFQDDALPRNANGKILKNQLRDDLSAGQ